MANHLVRTNRSPPKRQPIHGEDEPLAAPLAPAVVVLVEVVALVHHLLEVQVDI